MQLMLTLHYFNCCIDRCQSLSKLSILNNHIFPNQTDNVAQLKYAIAFSHSVPELAEGQKWSTCRIEMEYMSDKN